MTLIEFVAAYGYLAVLLGTLLEGETVLLLAGFAAHQGHLSIHWVLLIAFIGGTLGDQAFFWAGRHWGGTLLERFPSVRARSLRVGELLRRWDAALVFAIRFMYGLRIAGPILMGALHFDRKRFAVFNALGAAVWSLAIGGAGYLLGHSLQVLLGDLAQYESALLWGLVGVIVAGAVLHRVAGIVRLRRRLGAGDCGKAPPGV
jgi:membrane protein DedA with SNARE-associated domain